MSMTVSPHPAEPRSPWMLLVAGAALGAIAATAISLSVLHHGSGLHAASPAQGPTFKVDADAVTLQPGVPMRFDLEAATLSAPLPRTPVTARVATVDARTAPSFAPLAGRVVEVTVKLGDRVKEGDKLALIRSGELASMQRELKAAQLTIKTKQALVDRLQLLVESRAAPQNDLLVAQSELNEAKLSAATAGAQLSSLSVKQQGDTGYWVLATRSGTVVQLDASPGKQVGPERETPIVTVADLDEVVVVGDVPQKEAGSLKVGMDVLIKTPDATASALHGKIEVVSEVLDPERQTVPIRIRASNESRSLRPMAYVEAQFAPPEGEQLITVPTEAVVSDGATSVVFVESEPGVLRRRAIRTGRQTPERTEVLSGLAQGEKVVVRGALLLLNAIDIRGLPPVFEKIVAACLSHRLAVLVTTLIVFVWGIYSFRRLTIEAFPDPTDTQVQVITLNPGQPAEEMERQVSIPIERAVNGLPGLSRVRSINLFGLSFITLTFQDGVDSYFARAQTSERLRLVDLPDGVVSELGSLSTPIGEIYRYTLTSPRGDPLELRTVQDWVVRPKLLQVDGVADVVSYGGLLKEIEVRPDPVAMAAKNLTMADLEETLQKASINASGGVMERGSEQLVIRSEGMFSGLDDIGRVAVGSRGGTPILLSDVASVRVGWAPRQGIVGRGHDHDVVEGIVLMRRGENPSGVLEGVRAKVDELNNEVLTDEVKISVFYDRTELVSKTLQTVGKNLLEGALLVVTVLFVFLVDLRAALIVAALIPLALLCAFIYLHSRGMAANLLSMGAVDFGIIVDGAVVIIESIVLHMSGHHAPTHDKDGNPLSVSDRIHAAVIEVARPTFFSLLIIIAAYLPIFLLERVEGRIFSPMAHTVVSALVGSLLFSVTLVPVLATFAFSKPRPHRESPVLILASKAYLPMLRKAMRHPLLVLSIALVSLAGAFHFLANAGTEFLPEQNEGAMYLTFTLPANTSLTEGRKIEPVLTSIIDRFPQVESRISQLGRPEDGTDAKLANNLEIFVKLRPASEWPKDTPTIGALMEKMNVAMSEIPGLEVNFSQPIRDNVAESVSGQQGQLALKIFSPNINDLSKAAEDAKAALADIRGVADLGIVKSGEQPQVQVKPKREMLGRFGLSMSDVQNFLSTALAGRAVGTLWEGDRSFDVVLRLPEESRDTVELLSNLRIPTPQGALVPLSSVADITVGYGRAAINRENGQRYVGIRMNVRNRDMGSFVDEARKAVDKKVERKPGMQLIWGGEFESKERAMKRLELVVPVALLITFGLLFNVFRSVPLALLVLLNVPFATVGGALGLWVFDMPLSIAAAVGFIPLVGQASLNGVLVLTAIEQRRREGRYSIDDAIVQGAVSRLRADIMTATLASLGLVPAAFSKAMGAEMQRPIAVVIVGGTMSAALLTLVVLPVMYRMVLPLLLRMGSLSEVPPANSPEPPPATS